MNSHFLTFPISLQHHDQIRQRVERRRLALQTGRRRRDRHLAPVIPLPIAGEEPAREYRQAS